MIWTCSELVNISKIYDYKYQKKAPYKIFTKRQNDIEYLKSFLAKVTLLLPIAFPIKEVIEIPIPD